MVMYVMMVVDVMITSSVFNGGGCNDGVNGGCNDN